MVVKNEMNIQDFHLSSRSLTEEIRLFQSTLIKNPIIQCQLLFVRKLLSGVCVCVCVCVFVHVCVYVFILFRLLASSVCKTSVTYLTCSDQRSFVESISRGFCQVPSSLFLNLSYFTSKDENSSPQLLERKRYDIMWAREKMIYIDIEYKPAQRQKPTVTERY